MQRFLVAATLAVLFVVAACADTNDPSPSPSEPSSPTQIPSVSTPPSPTADPTPAPTPTPTPSTDPVEPTAEEQYLIDGILRDAEACQPVRTGLPDGAIAGIECTSDDPAVARIGFYLFEDEASTLDAYLARMAAEGIALDSGGCTASDGEGEGAYVPDEEMSPWRHGCFINAEGYANYRATLPGSHVYIGILGRSDDMAALADFSFRGNQDTPGGPTLWAEPGS